MITVTKVLVSKDLYIASVYLSFLENKVEIEDVLNLTKEQIAEIEHFMEEYIGEYSPIRSGFADLFNHLENNE